MPERSIHWVNGVEPFRLALMARPRGGEWLSDEVVRWSDAGVDTVVSLLESHEVRELDLAAERTLCANQGIEFRSFPVPDRGIPADRGEFIGLVRELHAEMLEGNAVAIHCRAGIGRTALLAGCLLSMLDVPAKDIFGLLSTARGMPVPDTQAQADWVRKYAPLSGSARQHGDGR